jgi:hypothetical protein
MTERQPRMIAIGNILSPHISHTQDLDNLLYLHYPVIIFLKTEKASIKQAFIENVHLSY